MSRIPFFIDFDRVLFDTDSMKERLCNCLRDAGFSDEAVQASYAAVAGGSRYVPNSQLAAILQREPQVQVNADDLLAKMYAEVHDLRYEETIPFLEKIDREKYEVVLLTLGDPGFQKTKIDSAQLESYFDAVHICTVDKADFLPSLILPNTPFLFLDDRLDTIQAIHDRYPASFPIFKDYKNEHLQFALAHAGRIVRLEDIRTLTLPEPFPAVLLD